MKKKTKDIIAYFFLGIGLLMFILLILAIFKVI